MCFGRLMGGGGLEMVLYGCWLIVGVYCVCEMIFLLFEFLFIGWVFIGIGGLSDYC